MMYYAHHADFSSKRKKRLIVLFNSEIYAIKAHTSFAQYLDFAVNRITARETVDLFSILIFHIKKKFINIYAIYVYIYTYAMCFFFSCDDHGCHLLGFRSTSAFQTNLRLIAGSLENMSG